MACFMPFLLYKIHLSKIPLPTKQPTSFYIGPIADNIAVASFSSFYIKPDNTQEGYMDVMLGSKSCVYILLAPEARICFMFTSEARIYIVSIPIASMLLWSPCFYLSVRGDINLSRCCYINGSACRHKTLVVHLNKGLHHGWV